jgi:hypothetical protein
MRAVHFQQSSAAAQSLNEEAAGVNDDRDNVDETSGTHSTVTELSSCVSGSSVFVEVEKTFYF